MKNAVVAIIFLGSGFAYAGEWIADPNSGCKVWNRSPAGSSESIKWDGLCKDGLATGKGTLLWFSNGTPSEKYVGEIQGGKRNGLGTYTWKDGRSLEGEWQFEEMTGFGKSFDSTGSETHRGWFENYRFSFSCASQSACRKQKPIEDARRAREESERIARACDRFFSGKAIGFKPAGLVYFGAVLDAVVLGKGSGNVSIKITDTHFDSYGKSLEIPCTSDQLK